MEGGIREGEGVPGMAVWGASADSEPQQAKGGEGAEFRGSSPGRAEGGEGAEDVAA